MRIRTLKPEFFTHESLFDAEKQSGLPLRVAFPGLWCVADREGRFKWEPRRLGVMILPYDGIDFSRVLDALWSRGFIRQFEADGSLYGVIPSFPRHQVINNRERDSEIPEPLEYNDFDACSTRRPRVEHASKEERKGKEGKGREGVLPLELQIESGRPPKPNSPLQIRIGQLLGRRASTKWSADENRLLKAIGTPDEQDMLMMERFYAAEIPKEADFRRTSMERLLKHWNGENDKAREWCRLNP